MLILLSCTMVLAVGCQDDGPDNGGAACASDSDCTGGTFCGQEQCVSLSSQSGGEAR